MQRAMEAVMMTPALAVLTASTVIGWDGATPERALVQDGGSRHGEKAGYDIKRRESYGKRDDWKA